MNETDSVSLQPDSVTTFPWPPRGDANPLDALTTTWREVVFHPTSFFRNMPREDDYGAVIAYYLIIGVVVAGIRLFWSSLFDFGGLPEAIFRAAGITQEVPKSNGIVSFLFSPLVLLMALYISAGLTHLGLWVLRGAKNGFDTTTRVTAFSYSPMLFTAVPFIGGLAGIIWMIVLTTIGLREAHQTTTGKGIAAILLPYLIIIFLTVCLAILVVALGLLNTRL